MIVAIDGAIVDPERAVISVLDRGLLYGDGAFEVLRTVGPRPVDLDRHVARLAATCAALALHLPSELRVREAIAAAGPGDHRVRIVITRGPGALAAPPATLGPGRAIVIVEPLGPQPRAITLAVVDLPLARRGGPAHKTLAYAEHLVARELARAAGADEAVRLGPDGDVVEGATSNLFVVLGGRVVTPPDRGILPGIVRGRVLEASGCEVRSIALAELLEADEIFVTSSLRGVVPVTRLGARALPEGPVTRGIAARYESDIVRPPDG